MSNYVSAVFSDEDQRETLELVAQLKAKLQFCIKLTNNQKKVMPKVDDSRFPFVEKGIQFGMQEPRVVPPFTNLDEYGKDMALFKNMGPVENELLSLTEMVTDTRMAAGTDAYQAALSIYNAAKGAVKMGVPGTQAIVDELGKLFDGQGPGKKEA
jgi:hypothetical protein